MLALKAFLDAQSKIKLFGALDYFLGIKVTSFSFALLLHQYKFISDLFQEYNYSKVTPVVSLELSHKLKDDVVSALTKPK